MNDNKIKFWSVVPGVEEWAPIVPAKEYIPKWWKGAPAHSEAPDSTPVVGEYYGDHEGKGRGKGENIKIQEFKDANRMTLPGKPNDGGWGSNLDSQDLKTRADGTIKLCPAIHDWFNTGWVLPMWCDLHIELFEDGALGVPGGKQYSFRTPHPDFQGGLMDNITYITWLPKEQQENGAVGFINLECPWRMKTPPGISCYQFPMYYHFNQDFEVPPGPIWTDVYAQVNPQIIIKRYGKITIKRGTPLCVFVPYERCSVDNLEMEIVKRGEKEKEWEDSTDRMIQTKFKGAYYQMQKEAKNAGCPYHQK